MPNPAMWDGSYQKQKRDHAQDARDRKRSLGRRKPLNPQSEAQAKRQAFLAGVKAERILLSIAITATIGCQRCELEFTTFSQAWTKLDLHHVTKRSQGRGYKGGDAFGVDDPRNLEILCRDCHRRLESNPEWSAA